MCTFVRARSIRFISSHNDILVDVLEWIATEMSHFEPAIASFNGVPPPPPPFSFPVPALVLLSP